jgi:hypothetical protein
MKKLLLVIAAMLAMSAPSRADANLDALWDTYSSAYYGYVYAVFAGADENTIEAADAAQYQLGMAWATYEPASISINAATGQVTTNSSEWIGWLHSGLLYNNDAQLGLFWEWYETGNENAYEGFLSCFWALNVYSIRVQAISLELE